MTVGLLATDPTISLHRACYNFNSFFISCYPIGLWADTPAVPTHFFINLLLRASLAHFPHLYLFWALLPNIPAMPTHFTTSFLEIPRPIYSFFTSFTPMGFLLNSLGFLSPIITSLPLITFRAYWPLRQSNEFTNSFSRLPQPIHFLFTSYYSHGLTTSFIGLPQPIFSFFTFFFFILVGLLAINPVILAYQTCFLIPLPFSPSHHLYCWASSAVGLFVKNGQQQSFLKKKKKKCVYMCVCVCVSVCVCLGGVGLS